MIVKNISKSSTGNSPKPSKGKQSSIKGNKGPLNPNKQDFELPEADSHGTAVKIMSTGNNTTLILADVFEEYGTHLFNSHPVALDEIVQRNVYRNDYMELRSNFDEFKLFLKDTFSQRIQKHGNRLSKHWFVLYKSNPNNHANHDSSSISKEIVTLYENLDLHIAQVDYITNGLSFENFWILIYLETIKLAGSNSKDNQFHRKTNLCAYIDSLANVFLLSIYASPATNHSAYHSKLVRKLAKGVYGLLMRVYSPNSISVNGNYKSTKPKAASPTFCYHFDQSYHISLLKAMSFPLDIRTSIHIARAYIELNVAIVPVNDRQLTLPHFLQSIVAHSELRPQIDSQIVLRKQKLAAIKEVGLLLETSIIKDLQALIDMFPVYSYLFFAEDNSTLIHLADITDHHCTNNLSEASLNAISQILLFSKTVINELYLNTIYSSKVNPNAVIQDKIYFLLSTLLNCAHIEKDNFKSSVRVNFLILFSRLIDYQELIDTLSVRYKYLTPRDLLEYLIIDHEYRNELISDNLDLEIQNNEKSYQAVPRPYSKEICLWREKISTSEFEKTVFDEYVHFTVLLALLKRIKKFPLTKHEPYPEESEIINSLSEIYDTSAIFFHEPTQQSLAMLHLYYNMYKINKTDLIKENRDTILDRLLEFVFDPNNNNKSIDFIVSKLLNNKQLNSQLMSDFSSLVDRVYPADATTVVNGHLKQTNDTACSAATGLLKTRKDSNTLSINYNSVLRQQMKLKTTSDLIRQVKGVNKAEMAKNTLELYEKQLIREEEDELLQQDPLYAYYMSQSTDYKKSGSYSTYDQLHVEGRASKLSSFKMNELKEKVAANNDNPNLIKYLESSAKSKKASRIDSRVNNNSSSPLIEEVVDVYDDEFDDSNETEGYVVSHAKSNSDYFQ